MRDWAHRDPESLRQALAGFAEGGLDPIARFARFATAAGSRPSTTGEDELVLRRAATLTVGSLLGFAAEPASLPVVRAHLERLRELLGAGTIAGADLVELYSEQVDFAHVVWRRMQQHGIDVPDMIDAQGLMEIAVREEVLWAEERPAVSPRPPLRAGAAYLAACAVYRDEAPYLAEWIEFHRLVGVDRFFLYDNRSTDRHMDVLTPYVERGIVVLHEWAQSPLDQRDVYDDCLAAHREDARWIAFLDIDEFLFSPTGASVAELLHELEEWPGVGVHWAMFSHSGHRTAPDGLVIESYPLRDAAESGLIKCIVDPVRTVRCDNAHWFVFDDGLPVDEHGWPIAGAQTKSTSFDRLRINHYASRSAEEVRRKIERGSGWAHLRGWRQRDLNGELELVRDESIARWAPALQDALRQDSR